MKTLQDIQRQLAAGEFDFSRHAFVRAVERNISEQEIREAGSALLLGFTASGRPLHFQVSFAEATYAKIITLYELAPTDWIDFRKRR